MAKMVRTNIVIDDDLVTRVMRTYGLPTKRAAIDFALRMVAGADDPHAGILALEGTGWAGDLDSMRHSRVDADRASAR
ncbi:MAG: type II toxin-antitoxin system VapB family antitoxin [Actinomycetota bacterium]